MKKITYICVFYNASDSINAFIAHLNTNIVDCQKEYIFVDDGSEDNTLNILKEATSKMPRTTIITGSHHGQSHCLNIAFNLASGDYIHFLEQGERLKPDASKKLINCLTAHDASYVIGKTEGINAAMEQTKTRHDASNQIAAILRGSVYNSRIGRAGTMITGNLLVDIDKCDEEIYTPSLSLSLECAREGRLALLDEYVTAVSDIAKVKEKRFEGHNNLKSVYNFCKSKPDFMCSYIPDLLSYLAVNCSKTSSKIYYHAIRLRARYLKKLDLEQVLAMYQKEINRLF